MPRLHAANEMPWYAVSPRAQRSSEAEAVRSPGEPPAHQEPKKSCFMTVIPAAPRTDPLLCWNCLDAGLDVVPPSLCLQAQEIRRSPSLTFSSYFGIV
eukprot:759165-Hanusia_phi.AAC.1